MGRVIQGSQMEKTPVVLLKEKEGSTFVGTKSAQKPGKTDAKTGKTNLIFEFKIEDGDAFVGIGTDAKRIVNGRSCKVYEPKEVKVGDRVTIFGDTQLNDKLGQVVIGERVKITFTGFMLNEKSGNAFANYIVEVL